MRIYYKCVFVQIHGSALGTFPLDYENIKTRGDVHKKLLYQGLKVLAQSFSLLITKYFLLMKTSGTSRVETNYISVLVVSPKSEFAVKNPKQKASSSQH